MEGVLACLRGWHAGLALAELEALPPNATLQPNIGALGQGPEEPKKKSATGRWTSPVDCSVSSLMDALRPRPKAPLNVG